MSMSKSNFACFDKFACNMLSLEFELIHERLHSLFEFWSKLDLGYVVYFKCFTSSNRCTCYPLANDKVNYYLTASPENGLTFTAANVSRKYSFRNDCTNVKAEINLDN